MLPNSRRPSCTDSTETALTTLAALGLSGTPFHEPFHGRGAPYPRCGSMTEGQDRHALMILSVKQAKAYAVTGVGHGARIAASPA